jgi:hypothetical protein
MGYPEADLPAGPFVPARHVDELKGVPEWSDINPRVGVSYDVFGTGRTAVKWSIGRFNQLSRSDLTRRFHPFSSSVNAAFRNWNDVNNNFIPDCDLANLSAQDRSASGGDICGAISNVNFGKFIPSATTFDQSVISANRDHLWEINAEVQHEITQGLSVSAGYNRNWDGSFQITENTLVGPQNFDEFCVTAPRDSRLPGGGGNELCGYYDVNPAFFGQGTLRVTDSREFGKLQRYWDGFAFAVNGRLPKSIRVGGGLELGKQVDDHCVTADMPNQPLGIDGNPRPGLRGGLPVLEGNFCRIVTDWANLMDFRLHGSVPLPAGFSTSFIYRNTPGAPIMADLTVTSAQVRFKNPARTALNTAQTVTLYAPNSVYGDRFTQLDLALNKTINLGRSRLVASLDLYNALNSSSIQTVIAAYSTTRWQRPITFLDARLLRVTGTLSF